MDKIEIVLDGNVDITEFSKSICFVSPAISNYNVNGNILEIEILEEKENEDIKEKLTSMMKKFKRVVNHSDYYFKNDVKKDEYYDLKNNKQDIMFWGNGQVSFSEKGKFLLEYFDELFCTIAINMDANEKFYPALLPVDDYYKTGYVKKSPQYSIFCSSIKDNLELMEGANDAVRYCNVNKILKEPQYALSPSACFHTYIEYKDKTLNHYTMITFRQNVFRNEGRLNYDEIGRLCDYHVREIVMIGSEDYVNQCRNGIMEKTVDIMKRFGLTGDIALASDSFVVPKMQMYRKIQRIDKSKYEMHLKVESGKDISTASFNLHGKAFTDPFNINVKGEKDTVTACVGYGLQRWVIAFFSQFGFDENNWPEEIANAYVSKQRGTRND